MVGWCLISLFSLASSLKGFKRTASVTPILPMSWRRLDIRRFSRASSLIFNAFPIVTAYFITRSECPLVYLSLASTAVIRDLTVLMKRFLSVSYNLAFKRAMEIWFESATNSSSSSAMNLYPGRFLLLTMRTPIISGEPSLFNGTAKKDPMGSFSLRKGRFLRPNMGSFRTSFTTRGFFFFISWSLTASQLPRIFILSTSSSLKPSAFINISLRESASTKNKDAWSTLRASLDSFNIRSTTFSRSSVDPSARLVSKSILTVWYLLCLLMSPHLDNQYRYVIVLAGSGLEFPDVVPDYLEQAVGA